MRLFGVYVRFWLRLARYAYGIYPRGRYGAEESQLVDRLRRMTVR
jgi:hypothetical protein